MNRSISIAKYCAEPDCPIAEFPTAVLMLLLGTPTPTDRQCAALCPVRHAPADSNGRQTYHFITPDNYSTRVNRFFQTICDSSSKAFEESESSGKARSWLQ